MMSGGGPEHIVGLGAARAYATDNAELRAALGVSPSGELEVEPLAHGEHNENYVLVRPSDGERFVLRINVVSMLGLEDPAAYEAHALDLLAGLSAAPRPIYRDSSRSQLPGTALVETYCPGLRPDYRSSKQVRAVLQSLASVHRTPVPEGSGLLATPSFPQCVLDEAREMLTRYAGHPQARMDLLQRASTWIDFAERLPLPDTSRYPARLLHGEPIPSNLLYDDDTGICHVIDWDCPRRGPVLWDLADMFVPTTTQWEDPEGPLFTRADAQSALEEYWNLAEADACGHDEFFADLDTCMRLCALRGIAWVILYSIEYAGPAKPLKNEVTFRFIEHCLEPDYLDMLEREFFS